MLAAQPLSVIARRTQIVHEVFVRRLSSASARKRGLCPFQTLGLSSKIEYKIVKKQFLKLALLHHPDTAVADKEDSKGKAEAVEMFMRVRKAFEQIIELEDGMAGLRSEKDSRGMMEGEEFNNWFYDETGRYAPDPFDLNLSPETLQEVADASAQQAGLDRGGMWFMAQSLTNGIGAGGLGSQLQLEQGDITVQSKDGTTKVRRRRNRN